MSWFEVYLWTRLDAIEVFFSTFVAISAIAGIITLIFSFISGEAWYSSDRYATDELIQKWNRKPPKFLKWAKINLIIFACCITGEIFVPDKEQAATIYVLPKIANSEIVKQVPEDLNDIYKIGVKSIKESLGAEEEITQIKKDLKELKDGQSKTK